MNQRIDFSKLGGFPATQYTLDYMQASYRNALMALALMLGDKVILTGVELVGGQYTNGFLSIGGEILPFVGGPAQSDYLIEQTSENRLFQNAVTNPVYFKKVARFGTPGTPFNQLRRIGEIMTSITNLNSHIGDMDNPHGVTKEQIGLSNLPNAKSDNHLLDSSDVLATTKATAAIAGKIIYTNSQVLSDFNNDTIVTINHGQNVLVSYIVVGSLLSVGTNYNDDNDVIWMIRDKLPDSFKLCLHEVAAIAQNLRFDYALIRL